jgi:hypothetical protein
MQIIVDGNGNWIEDVIGSVYDVDSASGPFECIKCGKEKDTLADFNIDETVDD